MFGHLDKAALKKKKQNWHMFHIETPILRGAGGEGHQLSFRVTDAQGHIYAGRGKGWVEQAVCILKFTLSLPGAQIKTSECGRAALASGPALAAVGGRLSVCPPRLCCC